MKIMQQDFNVSSKIWFVILLGFSIGLSYGLYTEEKKDLINIGSFLLVILLFMYGAYFFANIYEFKQKAIVIKPLFGLLGAKKYDFKDLKKVEYSISSRDVFDGIYLYFENKHYKKKITVSMYQVDLTKVKLFLYAHVENLEEIAVIEYRKFA